MHARRGTSVDFHHPRRRRTKVIRKNIVTPRKEVRPRQQTTLRTSTRAEARIRDYLDAQIGGKLAEFMRFYSAM